MINLRVLRLVLAAAIIVATVGCGGGQKVEIPTKTDPQPNGEVTTLSADESGNPTTTKDIKSKLKTAK